MTNSDSIQKIHRALLSVSDKTGLVELARALAAYNIEILSTGGTAKTLKEAGLTIIDVSDFTGFPEIMDGRVKTLHPRIHGGLLARRDNKLHVKALEDNKLLTIDMVVVNLYPFAKVVAQGADFDTCIENIDIGGPSLIRAAAKNHDFVTVLTHTQDYADFIAELEEHKGTTQTFRRRLAAHAYALTSAYDARIANWFAAQDTAATPRHINFAGSLKQSLRYGENPHQSAALYDDGSQRPGVTTALQIQGKELSYNNLNDTDAAFELVAEFSEPAVAIIKHANPCGVAIAGSTIEAYHHALRCDPVSAFGGIIALNRPLDAETAQEIIKLFSEVIIAPSITPEAQEIVKTKDRIRVLVTGAMPDPLTPRRIVRSLAGSLLVQDADTGILTPADLKIVTKRAPTQAELEDLLFAFRVAKHVKSNAIVYAKNKMTVGIGAGQMSRIDSTRIAAHKASEAAFTAGHEVSLTEGSVVASDAFFPFADGLIAAAEAGATAIIQPGGSIRDSEVIAAANERDLAMIFTGMRHFKH